LGAKEKDIISLRDEGLSWQKVADQLGLTSRDAAARAYTRAKSGDLPESIIRPTTRRARLGDVLDLEPAPFAVPIPAPAKRVGGKPRVTVVYGDTHFPHHSQETLDILFAVIRDVKPDTIINLGDCADCYTISAYDKDPSNIHGLQDELDMVRAHLHQIAQLAPESQRYYLEGNHEDRLRRLIWTLPGTARELARLRSFQRAMTWPSLLGLGQIGWQFVPSVGQARLPILPRIITKHGTVVRKWSGMSAKGEWERYGQSGISGHVHRLGRFYASDRNGAHTWVEAGCTCDTNPQYCEDPNWQNGLVVIEHSKDGKRFEMHLVYAQDGRALWRGVDYQAAA
jgi:hypothetical protein